MPENVGKLVILGAVVAVAIGIIALVSVSLEKLNSDEGISVLFFFYFLF